MKAGKGLEISVERCRCCSSWQQEKVEMKAKSNMCTGLLIVEHCTLITPMICMRTQRSLVNVKRSILLLLLGPALKLEN